MTSGTATTSPKPLMRSVRRVLILTGFGLLGSLIGYSFGWDAARQTEPVRVSFECEPPVI